MRTTYRNQKTILQLATFLVLLVTAITPAKAQWNNVLSEQATITPSANQFVKFVNASTGYYQNSRYLYKTTNGGSSWTRVDSSVASNYTRIDMHILSANDLFCIEAHNLGNYTYTYYLRKSSNGGSTWTSTAIPYVGNNTNGYFNDFNFSSTTNGVLSSSYGKIYHTTNGGASWTAVSLQTTSEYIAKFNFPTANIGYAVETFGKLYKTTNGGATWTFTSNICSINCANFQDIDFLQQDTGVAVNGYFIYKTVDGGQNWALKPVTGNVVVYRDVEYASRDTVYATGYSFIRSTDGGEHWQALSYLNPGTWLPFSTSTIYSVSAITGSNVFVTGGSNASPSVNIPGVYHMTNNGIGCPSTVMNANVTICPDTANNFTVQTTPTAPGAYVYSWTPSSYLNAPGNYYTSGTDTTADDTLVFTVTITDTTFGCPVASGQQTVITRHNSNWQNPWPWPTNPFTGCPGDTLHMGPGALGYHWSNGDTTEYTIVNTYPSFYNCMVDVCPNGMSMLYFAASLDSNCTVVQNCSVDAGHDTTFCQSPNPQLHAIPATPGNDYVFQWSPTTGLTSPNSATTGVYGVSNQQYIVTMTDTVTNCVAMDTVIVSEYHATTSGTSYVCSTTGITATLDFGPGATNYYWQYFTDTSGVTTPINVFTQTYTVSQPGTYMGYATFPNCGALTSIFHVVENCQFACSTALTAVPVTSTNCGDSVILYGASTTPVVNWSWAVGPYSYSGNNLDSLALFLTQGTYTALLTTTDVNGCIATATFNVISTHGISVDAGFSPQYCGVPYNSVQLNAVPTPSGNYTYSWTPSTGLSNPNIANPFVNDVIQQAYTVTITDLNSGCSASDTLQSVDVLPYHNDTIYNCNGSSVTIGLPAGSSLYVWNGPNGPYPNANTITVTQPGQYSCIAGYTNVNCVTTNLFNIIDSCSIQVPNVWPGDCNYDLTANMADALNIGVGYNTTGAQRPNATNGWYAQPMADWTQNFTNCNYKHGDADGNGIINVNDTLPISLNYSLTHPFRTGAPAVLPATAPTLELVANYDTCGLQTLVTVDIRYGTSAVPVDSLYGLSFRLTMDASLIDTTASSMDFNGSWLGVMNSDMIGFRKPFRSAGIIDACEVGNNQQNRLNGSGTVGTLRIVTTDNLSGIAVLHLGITDVKAITISEITIPSVVIADSVIIDPTHPASVPGYKNETDVHVFPNPANDVVNVRTGTVAETIELMDLLGQVMTTTQPLSRNTRIDVSTLPAGIYLLRVKTNSGLHTEKITITR